MTERIPNEHDDEFRDLTDLTSEHFVALVERMRDMQRQYFRRRTPEALQTCKELEKRVDYAVKRFAERGQRRLF